MCALEELLGSKLELGLCETLVPELQRLVDANPFRERLRMLLMVALHRTGRSVDALTTYATWRRTVTEVWGIEPGRAIRQLWDEIRGEAPRPSGAAQSMPAGLKGAAMFLVRDGRHRVAAAIAAGHAGIEAVLQGRAVIASPATVIARIARAAAAVGRRSSSPTRRVGHQLWGRSSEGRPPR